jgi:hypothetical protein
MLATKLVTATSLLFGMTAVVVACAGAPPRDIEPGFVSATGENAEELTKKAKDAGSADADVDAGLSDGGPRCPYGSLEDPHRGFVRCLAPEERDAGWLPPKPQGDPTPVSDAGADASPNPAPTAPVVAGPPPQVEVGTPKLEGGDITRLDKFLQKTINDVAKCVADNGGLTGASGSLKISFLVRSRGRAEGVEVERKNVSEAAGSCVRLLYKNRAVGAPSADPTGVTVTLTLKPAK